MLVVIPPQVYFERVFQGKQHYDSFYAFYQTVLQFRPYPDGNFSWHHLWYIPYILTYSLITLPLFRYLKSGGGSRRLSSVLEFFGRGDSRLLLWFFPFAIAEICLRPFWPDNSNDLINDWAHFASTLILFCFGFFLASNPGIRDAIERYRNRALLFGLFSVSVLYTFWFADSDLSSSEMVFYRLLRNFDIWCWLLVIFGFGRKYLNRNHPFLKYATEAVYPFYIVHQTVTVVIGFYLVHWQVGIAPKFAVVAAGTFAGSLAVFELVKRVNVTRILFGMKPLKRRSPEQTAAADLFAMGKVTWGRE